MKPRIKDRAPQGDVDDQRGDSHEGLALRIHPHIDEAAERAGQHRDRQRDHDPPQREVRAEDRQFPGYRAAVADQRPAHHHGDGGAEIGADGEQRRRHRIGGEGTAGQDRAERRADQQSLQPGLRPQRSGDLVVRQNFRDEAAEQAAGQHARHDFSEQPEIMGEDLEHAVDAVAPPDQACANHYQRADHDHRPADRLAGAPRLRLGVIGRRRVFYRML
jgi:hypothetical protein